MGRPATGQKPPVSFRPPAQLLTEFDDVTEPGRTRSDVLIGLMHEYVARRKRELKRKQAAEEEEAVPEA